MISSEEASELILNNLFSPKSEVVKIGEAIGRVIDEKIVADRDFPPFDRVMMDGIAINYASYMEGNREFKITGSQFAGTPVKSISSSEECMEVSTGAILPEGTDTVIKIEDVIIADEIAIINVPQKTKGKHVHAKGLDRKKGEILIKAGTEIEAQHIAILATVGKSEVSVLRKPKAAIVSTGDELVEVMEIPKDYQIRMSNNYMILSELEKMGIDASMHHINDDPEQLKNKLSDIMKKVDVLMLSGGVSKGKKDYLPEVLDSLGTEKLFHRVAQRPGKPFWFGKNNKLPVFAFPGNPVSSFMCFNRYFKPWYIKSMNLPFSESKAILTKNVSFNPDLTYYIQVKLEVSQDGRVLANPVEGGGSGDLANLLYSNAFMELPRDKSEFKAGEIYSVFPF